MQYYNDEIIDSHMHLWDLNNDYPWLKTKATDLEKIIGNYDTLRQNFLPMDYIKLTQNHHITKSVHVEVLGFPDNPVLETKWVQEQYDTYKVANAIIAHANLNDDNIESILKAHSAYKNIRGIRMVLNHHDTIDYLSFTKRGNYMQDSKWLYGFSLLEKYNLLFEAQIYPHQILELKEVALKYPEITIVLEHFAWPLDDTKDGYDRWVDLLRSIAVCDNIVLKLSNIMCGAFKNIETIIRYIHKGIEIFGVNRCMFGSNCPPDTVKYDFETIMSIYKEACSIYPISQQRQIFYENAAKVYNI